MSIFFFDCVRLTRNLEGEDERYINQDVKSSAIENEIIESTMRVVHGPVLG